MLFSNGAESVTESGSQPNIAELAEVNFRDRQVATQNWVCVRRRVPHELLRPLVRLLAQSPDPDAALNLFERLTATAGRSLSLRFERHPILLHYAVVVLGYSQYLGETLIQNLDLFQVLLREGSLDRAHSRDEFGELFARFRSRTLDTDISLLLARFRRREYVRIMLRDVLRRATLAETTVEISALADALIEVALRDADMRLRNRYGPPQTQDSDGRLTVVSFTVLSLGKLGGNELNYSSDIDLLFLHGDGEAPPGAAVSNREYFIRLAQQVTETLSTMTKEGVPFRTDLRLRPQGGEGEPAVALSHALDYYAGRAADWERQAMIKVRHSAGDQVLAREFIRRVQPFVYTEQINFAAIDTALEARERIRFRRRRGMAGRDSQSIDVKLDRGGIRDIEFLVQCLQRVYGGTETWLRSGGTLFSLQKLHDKEHISGKDFQELTTAYEFLRTVEHRMQLRHGQQTHRLPVSEHELKMLARMVIPPPAEQAASSAEGQPHTESIVERVRCSMAAVARIYSRIVQQQQIHQQREDAEFRLRSVGEGATPAHRQVLDRLVVDAPALYELVQSPDIQMHARRNLYRFLTSALTATERYATVARAPEALKYALEVFGLSDYLTETLISYPQEIATLEKLALEEESALPGRELGQDSRPQDLASGAASYNDRLAQLRQHYRARLFASGARDVLRGRPVWEALVETTAAADEAVQRAAAIAEVPAGFAIFALGRLGSREHDLLSDADLFFVREETLEERAAHRAAERMVEVLSAYTRDGAVFPVDARLRPHGGEGELVVTLAQLENYFEHEALAWEALTYTKSRFVAGHQALAERVQRAVNKLMRRFAADQNFGASVRQMRTRLEKTDTELDNLKTGPGALYDIDFLVGSLLVRHGIGDTHGSLWQRLASLRDRGLLEANDCQRLQGMSTLLRTAEHVFRLVTGRNRHILPVSEQARTACEELCRKMLRREFPEGLEISLRFALVGVRSIYDRIVT